MMLSCASWIDTKSQHRARDFAVLPEPFQPQADGYIPIDFVRQQTYKKMDSGRHEKT